MRPTRQLALLGLLSLVSQCTEASRPQRTQLTLQSHAQAVHHERNATRGHHEAGATEHVALNHNHSSGKSKEVSVRVSHHSSVARVKESARHRHQLHEHEEKQQEKTAALTKDREESKAEKHTHSSEEARAVPHHGEKKETASLAKEVKQELEDVVVATEKTAEKTAEHVVKAVKKDVDEVTDGKYVFREWSKLLGVDKERHFEDLEFGTSVEWMWFGVVLFMLLMFAPAPPKWKLFEQCRVTVGFIVLAGIYNVGVYKYEGREAAEQWFTGYVLELMLSFDNLFVFYLVFQRFRTPAELQSTILAYGIISAMVLRAVFYMMLFGLMGTFTFVRVLCGLMLLYSSTQIFADDEDEDFDADSSFSVRAVNYLCGDRLETTYPRDGSFFSWDETRGRVKLTMMVFVIGVIELTDIAFAADSVSAKIAAVPDVYLNTSSTAMAMLSLRSVFFIMSDLIEAFDYVKYGVGFILVIVGTEVMASPWYEVKPHTSFSIILGIFLSSVLLSVLFADKQAKPKENNKSDVDRNQRTYASPVIVN